MIEAPCCVSEFRKSFHQYCPASCNIEMPHHGLRLDDQPLGRFSTCVAIFLVVLCCGKDIGVNGQRENANSNGLSCVYRGNIVLHDETLRVDACTDCHCNSGTVSCQIKECPETKSCKKPVIPEGECCPRCPNDLVVNSVTPKVRNKNAYQLYANRNNSLEVKVKVKFSDTAGATEVTGKALWGLGVWLSPNRDTGLPRYGYVDQILSYRQSSQNYLRDRKFSFRNLIYEFDDPEATCHDMKYICVELRQGANVRPGHFTLDGFPDESSLSGCNPAPKCKT